MEIVRGIISAVATEAQWELINAGELDRKDIALEPRTIKSGDNEMQVLDFQLAEKKEGEEKITYTKVSAFGKQMRIIEQLGTGHPVSIAVSVKENGAYKNYTAQVVQDEKSGLATN